MDSLIQWPWRSIYVQSPRKLIHFKIVFSILASEQPAEKSGFHFYAAEKEANVFICLAFLARPNEWMNWSFAEKCTAPRQLHEAHIQWPWKHNPNGQTCSKNCLPNLPFNFPFLPLQVKSFVSKGYKLAFCSGLHIARPIISRDQNSLN